MPEYLNIIFRIHLLFEYLNISIDNFQDVNILTPSLQDVDNINSTKYVINNSIENVMKMIEDLQREISNVRKQQGQVKETDYRTKYTEYVMSHLNMPEI